MSPPGPPGIYRSGPPWAPPGPPWPLPGPPWPPLGASPGPPHFGDFLLLEIDLETDFLLLETDLEGVAVLGVSLQVTSGLCSPL